ncbi:FMN-binding protein [Prosthecochloris sp. N3]|uniref:Na(+)-translocating NADH-quinone reductase subunit C n=1 Tax=Prosthecochloris ethylica TaxID=2743976 RepID=A0ABR9XTL4_9CHLB|nr:MULTISPECIES: FMN-binding protein [Prosthecochloris]MEC9486727.1 FMN-binding protein [Prosthecochloris sp.]MBF0587241.1 FMN-binding protein [Prosthecochloris ethylica]MBF0637314.1 FMN-binding protein [Prosthecochloris ethylica]NUK48403.1 FMN-binding protein [Prosthecochloris ethylica]RNA65595.1 FMN-binding protein [Prosthecochloris sp. ZM_2]
MHSSNGYTYFFVISMAVVSALLLSVVTTSLQERQEFNRAVDVRENLLKAVGALEEGMTPTEIDRFYRSMFTARSIEGPDGQQHDYYRFGPEERPLGYVLPVSGKGAWSTIRAFLALEPDLNTIKGITFYEHGETPGLGGEIENERFTRQFVGKKIFRDGELVSITIAKAALASESPHAVDGISGASITTGSINRFLKKDLMNYKPLLEDGR